VIAAVNGAPVKDARTLAQKIASEARDGQTKTIDLAVAEMPKQQQVNAQEQGRPAGEPHLGLSLAPAQDVAGSGDKGVVVTGEDPNGPAAQNGMRIGDVIFEAGGKTVETPSDVRDADWSRPCRTPLKYPFRTGVLACRATVACGLMQRRLMFEGSSGTV
jgi:serine protease Do